MDKPTKDMKKPASLIYGLEDSPPLSVTIFNGVQHVGVIAINLVYPLLIFRAANAPVELVTSLLALGMLILGVGTFIQARGFGPVGSRFMCPQAFTATHFGPSLQAVAAGGLPLVFGMTFFAGALEAAIAPLLNRLRAVFPPEISGLVILMIGLSGSIAGLRSMLGSGSVQTVAAEWYVAGITLAAMAALNVWATGLLRMLCALIGLVIGYITAIFAGLVNARMFDAVKEAPAVALPSFGHLSWSFDVALIAPFAIAAVAAAMKAAGTMAVCQRSNDANWVRPDMQSVTSGVLADGVTTALSGIVGGVGTTTSTPTVGLAAATGVTSRKVAYAVGAIFIILSLFPKLTALFAVIPRAVIVPALIFTLIFVVINGIQVINSRLMDARRTLTIGIAIIGGVAVEVFPSIAASAPNSLAPLIGSSLVFSTVIALVLNMLFRIGVRKTVRISIDAQQFVPQAIEDFLQKSGAAWGARPDIVKRATFGANQLIETLTQDYLRDGPISIEASFDEFNLDVRATYIGDVLTFPERRPSNEEIRDSEDGARLLAGFMLRRNADRVRSEAKDGRTSVLFHFDH